MVGENSSAMGCGLAMNASCACVFWHVVVFMTPLVLHLSNQISGMFHYHTYVAGINLTVSRLSIVLLICLCFFFSPLWWALNRSGGIPQPVGCLQDGAERPPIGKSPIVVSGGQYC